MTTTNNAIRTGPAITQLEFEENDFLIAKRVLEDMHMEDLQP